MEAYIAQQPNLENFTYDVVEVDINDVPGIATGIVIDGLTVNGYQMLSSLYHEAALRMMKSMATTYDKWCDNLDLPYEYSYVAFINGSIDDCITIWNNEKLIYDVY